MIGLNFFITEIPYEVFTYNEHDPEPMKFEKKANDLYPYMVRMYRAQHIEPTCIIYSW